MNEARLVERAQSGDELSFRRLLDEARPQLIHIVREWFLPGADWDDLMQEARIGFAKAVRDFKGDGGASFRNFSTLCVRRSVITAVKTATRQKHEALNTAVSFAKPVVPGEVILEDILVAGDHGDPHLSLVRRQELQAVLETIVLDLSEREERAVLGRLVGLSYREIVEACPDLWRETGSTWTPPRKSVDNSLMRARAKLRARLAPLEEAA